MSLLPLVEFDDFDIRVGPIGETETARAEALLDDVSALVRKRAGQTWEDPDDVPDDVRAIVFAVAGRAWRSQDGAVAHTIGSYSESFSRDGVQGIFLTDIEEKVLADYRTTTGLWTLRTTRSDFDCIDTYIDVVDSEPIPFLPAGELI